MPSSWKIFIFGEVHLQFMFINSFLGCFVSELPIFPELLLVYATWKLLYLCVSYLSLQYQLET